MLRGYHFPLLYPVGGGVEILSKMLSVNFTLTEYTPGYIQHQRLNCFVSFFWGDEVKGGGLNNIASVTTGLQRNQRTFTKPRGPRENYGARALMYLIEMCHRSLTRFICSKKCGILHLCSDCPASTRAGHSSSS